MTTFNHIADYFISLSNETQNLITNMKLQKLVYYVQAWHIAVFNKSVFAEDFEAWVHGPVLKPLYGEYKTFTWNPIIKKSISTTELKSKFSQNLKDIIADVSELYFGLSAYELERLTHSDEPWIKAREGLRDDQVSHNIIKKEWMKIYYAKYVKK